MPFDLTAIRRQRHPANHRAHMQIRTTPGCLLSQRLLRGPISKYRVNWQPLLIKVRARSGNSYWLLPIDDVQLLHS